MAQDFLDHFASPHFRFWSQRRQTCWQCSCWFEIKCLQIKLCFCDLNQVWHSDLREVRSKVKSIKVFSQEWKRQKKMCSIFKVRNRVNERVHFSSFIYNYIRHCIWFCFPGRFRKNQVWSVLKSIFSLSYFFMKTKDLSKY